ncbi:MAG: hypothetical protein H6709_05665 [Kofleriaceae bacterium]|nr:hypothetical protein [Kofleriaceae bacterium]MCB9571559.1 hypothetical protein [Kofleriaceae bacterium]
MRDVGGTSGGLGWFLAGIAMLGVGVYLLLNQVTVHGGYWRWGGGGGQGTSFGLSLLPLLVGVGILFFNGRSLAGWLIAGLGLLIVIAGIIVNLQIHFRSATLWDTLLILALIAGGIGTIARSVRPFDGGRARGDRGADDRDAEA